jgi:hypothetical protein
MRAFIVRPFGVKEGIDFDRVESKLIQPALELLSTLGFSVQGGTTGEISKQGNIREDMFRALVVADLVIADVSIHNANAFYELGIRHALRPRSTFLIRSHSPHAYPFDLQTDRYFLYDANNPAGDNGSSVEGLAMALRSTLASEEFNSPVFNLLPNLKPHGRSQLVSAPSSFREEVEQAKSGRLLGNLRLLAQEATFFDWDQEGLRLVGEAQFGLRANHGARETFELLRRADPDDFQANRRLATIYQRLANADDTSSRDSLLKMADQAVNRALRVAPTPAGRAEAYALLASNEKSRWIAEWKGGAEERWLAIAMNSPRFGTMLRYYLKGVSADLNAHYPAINALALLKAQIQYAERCKDDWVLGYESDEEANLDLEARKRCAARLESALSLALEKDSIVGRRDGDADAWAESSRADFLMLTANSRPERVGRMYERVLADADSFTIEATLRNLHVFKDLGLFEPNVSAALASVDEAERKRLGKKPAPSKPGLLKKAHSPADAPAHVILFTGHMVDAPDRPKERTRFPATSAAEAEARKLIAEAVRAELQAADGRIMGMAGGAAGADILFHEVCAEQGMATELLLALPPEKFQVTSVQRGGPAWVERYRKVCRTIPPRVLQVSESLPDWLVDNKGYDLWQRNNLWMMFSAIASGARQRTLIALYNRDRSPDGPGGTGHLFSEAHRWGFKIVELDAARLLAADAVSR